LFDDLDVCADARCPASACYLAELFPEDVRFQKLHELREGIESDNFAPRILEWVSAVFHLDRISSRLSQWESVTRLNHVGNFELRHVCQRLRIQCRKSRTLVFDAQRVHESKKLTVALADNLVLTINRKALTLSIQEFGSGKPTLTVFDSLFKCASSMAVSRDKLFLVVDFKIGITRCFRLIYFDAIPTRVLLVAEFSFLIIPKSIVSGEHWLVATTANERLIIWEISGGTIHRIVSFDSTISQITFDESHGIWVATKSQITCLWVNGEVITQASVAFDVTAIEAIQLPQAQTPRAAIVGTSDGQVLLAQSNVMRKEVEFKTLLSEHRAKISKIVVHPGNKMFITIDESEVCFAWSAVGIAGEPVAVSMYETCNFCRRQPDVICTSCRRAVCNYCDYEGMCALCTGLKAI
jgi:hypothetical protein